MFLNVNLRLIFLTLPMLPSHVSSPCLQITFKHSSYIWHVTSFILHCIVTCSGIKILLLLSWKQTFRWPEYPVETRNKYSILGLQCITQRSNHTYDELLSYESRHPSVVREQKPVINTSAVSILQGVDKIVPRFKLCLLGNNFCYMAAY